MTLSLSLLTDEDVHDFAVVDDAAMADWPYAQAMGLNLPMPRIQMVEDWVRHGLETDSTQTYLKVTDEKTGEMVAGALWAFEPLGEEKKDGNEKKAEVDEQDEEKKMAAAFAKARMAMWKEFEGEYFPRQPYASESSLHVLSCRAVGHNALCIFCYRLIYSMLLELRSLTTCALPKRPPHSRHHARPPPTRRRLATHRMGHTTCR